MKQELYKINNIALTYAEKTQYEKALEIIEHAPIALERAKISALYTLQEEQKIENARRTKRLLEGKGAKRMA